MYLINMFFCVYLEFFLSACLIVKTFFDSNDVVFKVMDFLLLSFRVNNF